MRQPGSIQRPLADGSKAAETAAEAKMAAGSEAEVAAVVMNEGRAMGGILLLCYEAISAR